jgi:hypothetical protein
MDDDRYDVESYRDFLIKNGLDPAIAAQVAEKTKGANIPTVAKKTSRKATAKTVQVEPAIIDVAPVAIEAPPENNLPGIEPEASPEAPKKQRASRVTAQSQPETFDFRSSKPVPSWIKEVIETHLAIEAEDAKKAGALGFMARALVIATMPYKDQKNPDGTPKESFTRQNGDFKLRIVAGYDGGIPFGIYPRLLMSWVTTEAVRKQSPVIELGDSLRTFLRDVLDLRVSGGKRGTATRVSEQMKRLFGSLITAQYSGSQEKKGFVLKNVLIADELEVNEEEQGALWTPQRGHEAGTWQSKVKLTNNFFQECITNPVPIDLRAYKVLRGSPLAMDIYTWLTYRMSYIQSATRPITWEALMLQFGSGYGSGVTSEQGIKQAVLDFKRNFLKALKLVHTVYPEARLSYNESGLILLPSPTHIATLPGERQPGLF